MAGDRPTPDDLLVAPQLAIIATLDAVLHHASAAIVASHTELMSAEEFEDAPPESPSAWLALDLLHLMDALSNVLDNYRLSLRPPPREIVRATTAEF